MEIGGFEDDGFARERLSAFADGELDSRDSAATCSAWSGDPGLRADWHAWHLIGDVLRSDDLAADPRGDRRMVEAVRIRLQREPVVLAPARAVSQPRVRPTRWAAAGAVAAGALLVAGTFALLRPSESSSPAVAIAESGAPAAAGNSAAAPVAVAELAAPPIAIVADNKVIRDAQLDRYLEAHKQFAGSSALGVPSAFLRGATVGSASR